MHEKQRHRIIISATQDHPVIRVAELCSLTGASEATIRRDIATLHDARKIRRVRGGAEALTQTRFPGLAGRSFSDNETRNIDQKRAIAREAVELCDDGEPIIINGGTTTFQMVHPLANRRCQVFTNSFPIAEHLLKNSQNSVMLPGGLIYREQNIVLSPFDNDVTRNFYARRMFMGAQGVAKIGVMEADPLLIQAEQKLIGQADELVLLVDSSKFENRSSLVLCPLERINVLITDDRISDRAAAMIEATEVKLIIAGTGTAQGGCHIRGIAACTQRKRKRE